MTKKQTLNCFVYLDLETHPIMKRIFLFLAYTLSFICIAQTDSLTLCEQDLLNATGMPGEFVPACEEDGSYSTIQCWGSTGYCWCVDEIGLEIPGTSIPSWQGMPDCSSSQDACTLIPDPGPCFAAIQAYYFNQDTQQCEDFIWGGCAGVVPFESLLECEVAACSESTEINETNQSMPKLVKIIDLLGREGKVHLKGQLLFYIYEDGIVEKRITL